ncbi:LysR substrate-binding domain-containing protein [Pseudoclavibacter sp. RFBA6]|uniref:LysR substrate-binding domain-containing protein n=1 Tax=Pseudoclavibacter sp. RFBA6 TaxID=2080573 RepID=UPI000CE8033A|nr:LysR substrate-binding domain-containing protein [Pseudoclavibacter sp. RFBA6]PPG38133.1 LysR family transcriptional regulator [Pseudoclavibacter sp. RFBA6]
METRRLEYLVDLERLGSMRAVADQHLTTTSVVSQQLALLQQELGAHLLERVGRGVRLTAAGSRLAARASGILASLDEARRDFDPDAEPQGTLRVAGFATAARALFPIMRELADSHPGVRLVLEEQEPDEALALVDAGRIDLALVYDYTLAPLRIPPGYESVRLWEGEWGIGVPDSVAAALPGGGLEPLPNRDLMLALREREWIGNSRNNADEIAIGVLASLADYEPNVTHQSDDLALVEDLIAAEFGVGMLPLTREPRDNVRIVRMQHPPMLRASAAYLRGTAEWPLLRHVLDRLTGR